MASSDKWFPEGYSPNITTERWLELLGDKEVAKEESLIVLKCMKDFGGEATCKQLSAKYGRHAQFYNLASSRLAKRVAQKTGCPVLARDNSNSKWWPILYLGRYAEDTRNGVYIWKLRPELSAALEQYDLNTVPFYNYGEKIDEYQLAAEMLMGIAAEKAINTDTIALTAEKQRLAFVERFSPERLLAIPDDELLRTMYYAQQDNKKTLSYNLESVTSEWGSIWGGSSYKFGMFQRAKDGQWMNASGYPVTEEQALNYAKTIRSKLVQAIQLIKSCELATCNDAEELDGALAELFGKSYDNLWLKKYIALLYPNKMSSFYSDHWQNHVLCACGILPSKTPYARSAQIAMIANHAGWHYPEFFAVFTSCFGNTPKRFYRLEAEVDGKFNLE